MHPNHKFAVDIAFTLIFGFFPRQDAHVHLQAFGFVHGVDIVGVAQEGEFAILIGIRQQIAVLCQRLCGVVEIHLSHAEVFRFFEAALECRLRPEGPCVAREGRFHPEIILRQFAILRSERDEQTSVPSLCHSPLGTSVGDAFFEQHLGHIEGVSVGASIVGIGRNVCSGVVHIGRLHHVLIGILTIEPLTACDAFVAIARFTFGEDVAIKFVLSRSVVGFEEGAIEIRPIAGAIEQHHPKVTQHRIAQSTWEDAIAKLADFGCSLEVNRHLGKGAHQFHHFVTICHEMLGVALRLSLTIACAGHRDVAIHRTHGHGTRLTGPPHHIASTASLVGSQVEMRQRSHWGACHFAAEDARDVGAHRKAVQGLVAQLEVGSPLSLRVCIGGIPVLSFVGNKPEVIFARNELEGIIPLTVHTLRLRIALFHRSRCHRLFVVDDLSGLAVGDDESYGEDFGVIVCRGVVKRTCGAHRDVGGHPDGLSTLLLPRAHEVGVVSAAQQRECCHAQEDKFRQYGFHVSLLLV